MAIDLQVFANLGEPVKIVAQLENGITCEIKSETALAVAREHPLTMETLIKQLGRLGGTPFELRDLQAEIIGSPMAPFSVMGKLRHELVAALDHACQQIPVRAIAAENVLSKLRAEIHNVTGKRHTPGATGQLSVLCRSLDQLRCLLNLNVREIYADFQDIREYREAVALAQAASSKIWLATPRIQKPAEMGIFHALAKQQPHGILVRNFGGVQFYSQRSVPMIGDFSLNVTNELTADYFMRRGSRV